jgi:hypothetical protein
MKIYQDKIILTLLFGTFLGTKVAYTQFTTTAPFLLQSIGSRGLALGESYVAVADGSHSLYWNPAGMLASKKGVQFVFTHRPSLFGDFMSFDYATLVYQPNSRLAVAAHFNYVGFGATLFEDGVRDTYAYTIGTSLAMQVVKNLRTGLTLKRVAHEADPFSAHSVAADLGLIYRLENILNTQASKGQLSLGASLSNLGQKFEHIEGQANPLPQFLRLGFSYDVISNRTWGNTGLSNVGMLLSFEYQNLLNEKENIWEWGGGVELRFLEIVAFRLGYHERHPKTRATFIGKTLETGPTIGFGLNLPLNKLNTSLPLVLQFDFASAPQNGFVEDYQMYTFAVSWEL